MALKILDSPKRSVFALLLKQKISSDLSSSLWFSSRPSPPAWPPTTCTRWATTTFSGRRRKASAVSPHSQLLIALWCLRLQVTTQITKTLLTFWASTLSPYLSTFLLHCLLICRSKQWTGLDGGKPLSIKQQKWEPLSASGFCDGLEQNWKEMATEENPTL